MAKHFTIYACDIIGFGRSSRPAFVGTEPEDAEAYFLSHLHGWIEALDVGEFILGGHSFGAYLTCQYMFQKKNTKYVLVQRPQPLVVQQ